MNYNEYIDNGLDEEEEDFSEEFPINVDYGYDDEDAEDFVLDRTSQHNLNNNNSSIGVADSHNINSGNAPHRSSSMIRSGGGTMAADGSMSSSSSGRMAEMLQHSKAGNASQTGNATNSSVGNNNGTNNNNGGGGSGSGAGSSSSVDDLTKPRILLMGLRRSGKSSIQKVVFQKMSPHETLFLESTHKIVKNDISNNSFVQFQIWDFPGQIDFFDSTFESEFIFGGCGALLFVIDAQDEPVEAINKLNQTVMQALKVNRNIIFEVFIHKVDGISDDNKIETQREIQQHVQDNLIDNELGNVPIRYHLTSIYDHTIFEAFSKVIQKLIPQLPTLENLLDMLVANSRLEKAFLFDVVSKIYIATDSSPVDNTTYELCSDMIDVVIDISCIYGARDGIDAAAYDEQTNSVIKLNNNTVLYLREVNKYLALVCILHKDNYDKIGLIDYNFTTFRRAIEQVFAVSCELQQRRKKQQMIINSSK